jgi:predicted AAA+ superfamily ATPase
MENVFKEILSEKPWEHPLSYIPRDLAIPDLPGKALSVIGIRRCGKTTFLRQIWDRRRQGGKLAADSGLYVNFFDERLYGLPANHLGKLLEAFEELHPDRTASSQTHVFLDEIQSVKGWEMFADRLLRSGYRVYVSGSSATLLSKEISSAMRGRALALELFPFSFREALRATGVEADLSTSRLRARVKSVLNAYLMNGGFPEVLSVTPALRRQILQEYFNVVVLKDVVERHNPSDPASVSALARLLMNQVGGAYTLNKTRDRLLGMGHKVAKEEVSDALDWFHDAYLYFSVPVFANSVTRQAVNPRKIYCIDSGMAAHIRPGISDNRGHLLENVVFLHLRRRTERIFYFRDEKQREVDFVHEDEKGRLHLVQVTWSLQDPAVRRRETESLWAAMERLGLRRGTIVTLDESEEIRRGNRVARVVPAWEYLLSAA